MPAALQTRFAAAQRPGRPFFSPAPPAEGAPPSLLDAGALYAGESVARIDEVVPARQVVADLTP
jgi:nitronate monooxygenase